MLKYSNKNCGKYVKMYNKNYNCLTYKYINCSIFNNKIIIDLIFTDINYA